MTTPKIPESAIRYLRNMLEGTHQEAIYEWIYEVSKIDYQIPPEYIPTLLEIGDEIESMRPYIVKIIGLSSDENRVWVATIADNLEEYLYDVHVQQSEFDAFMIGALSSATEDSTMWIVFSENPRLWADSKQCYPYNMLPYLNQFKLPWSSILTEVFLRAIYMSHGRIHWMNEKQFPYRLSLSIISSRLQAWQNIVSKQHSEYKSTLEMLEQTIPIYEYRQEMVRAIKET